MNLDLVIQISAIVTVVGAGVVYGTDVFCAMVMRPALARIDNDVLVAVMGHVHHFGDRRMPLPGALGVAGAAVCTAAAVAAGHEVQTALAGTALAALSLWLPLYTRVSAPVNRQLTAAATAGETLANGRALQARWDSIIAVRALLQGVAVTAACVTLLS